MIVLDHQDMGRRGSHIVVKAKSIEDALGRTERPQKQGPEAMPPVLFSRSDAGGNASEPRERPVRPPQDTHWPLLEFLNGVNPRANWPFEGAREHRQFSPVFQKTTVVLLSVSKPWNCHQAERVHLTTCRSAIFRNKILQPGNTLDILGPTPAPMRV